MTDHSCEYFSENYATARRRFIIAANDGGAELHKLPLSCCGPDGGDLSIDIAWFGATSASSVVIHSSALHGVEGFAGSAIQLAIIERQISVPENCALILVHTLNPFGMAWLRRANENNVDLNRNFGVEAECVPLTSQLYGKLHPVLNSSVLDNDAVFFAKLFFLAFRFGIKPLRQAIAGGQYEYENGLFFGGAGLEEGPDIYQSWLTKHLKSVNRGIAIDVHTGLGKSAQESLFLRRTSAVNQLWGNLPGRKIVAGEAEDGAGYETHGSYANCFDVLPEAVEFDAITQEFGTFSSLQVLNALRKENHWHHYGDGGIAHATKPGLKEMFSPAAPEWRDSVVEDGISLIAAVSDSLFSN